MYVHSVSEQWTRAGLWGVWPKVVFASAHPFVELKDALETYAQFDFTDEVRQKIMIGNAKKILGMS